MVTEDRQPATEWSRLHAESDRAWAAFLHYRSLPPQERSLLAVSKALGFDVGKGNTPSTICKWRVQHRWVERVSAWDEHCAEQSVRIARERRQRLAEQAWDDLEAVLATQRARIAAMTPSEASRWADALVRILSCDPLRLSVEVVSEGKHKTVNIRFDDHFLKQVV